MPSTEKVEKSKLTGVIDNLLDKKASRRNKDGSPDFLTIIEFIERFHLLPYGLFPAQKFILKLYYGLPLDNVAKVIKIRDPFSDKIEYEFTEKEYLSYLYEQGRCNIKEQDSESRFELVLVLGRRSGKSTLAALIAAYELYKLLRRGCPQEHYGISTVNEIRVLCIANDKEQASIVYGEMSGYINQVDYFKSSITHDTQTYMKFQTDYDKRKYGEGSGRRASIISTFKSSIAKGLRGRGTICVILDELAFFVDDGKCEQVFSNIQTNTGLTTFEEILSNNHVDRSKIGWTSIDPIRVIQESGVLAFATHVYYGGYQKTRRLTTKRRYSIEPTPEHRLKVMSPDGNIVWKYVSNIKLGDFIGINRSTNLWPGEYYDCSDIKPISNSSCDSIKIPTNVDVGLGEFLGILVGDGTWRSGKTRGLIQVTGGCEQFLSYVKAHFSRYFSSYACRHKSPHGHNTCEVSPWMVTKNSILFRAFLNRIGYRLNVTKSTKSVPWVIFKSPKNVVAAFLRGFFETDGGLERKGDTITASTASRKLASEIQLLLLNFGITSSILHKWNKKYSRYYYIVRVIGYTSRITFRNEIGFITERKGNLLDIGCSRGRDASNVIPHQYDRLRKILESIPKAETLSKGNDARTRMIRLCSSSSDFNRRSRISYDSAQRIVKLGRELCADKQSIDELDEICHINYFWDQVTSIDESEAEVADLMIPDGSQYVAQGFTNHNSSAQRVYKAITPGIGQFSPKDPNNKHVALGPPEGRIISISSPDAREGFFYNLYQQSLTKDEASSNMLMIQAPTWEINPTLFNKYYSVEYAKDPKSFDTEHGGSFSDRVRGWIENHSDLTDCISYNLKPIFSGRPREPFFAGVDFGIVKDGTAIALTHIKNGKIETAYHEVWYAGKSWKESNPHLTNSIVPYVDELQGSKRIDIDEIINWFVALSRRFFILKGVFDQWAGPIFEQKLHKSGLTQFEMKNFSVNESSQIYQMAKMLMYARQLRIYDYPLPESKLLDAKGKLHSPMISELLELQSRSGGKNITVVEAPSIAGKHDDVSDALVRSISLAVEYTRNNPGSLDATIITHTSQRQAQNPIGYHQFQRIRARMHGQMPKERRVPLLLRRGN